MVFFLCGAALRIVLVFFRAALVFRLSLKEASGLSKRCRSLTVTSFIYLFIFLL